MMDDAAAFRRFYEGLSTLVGEIPTEALVSKVNTEVGADALSRCRLMGHLAFSAKCFGQGDDALDFRRRDAFLDLIVGLSKEP